MKRKQITDKAIDNAFALVKTRMKEALKKKGRGSFASIHEISGVITEEYDEMKREVIKNNRFGVQDECQDIAIASIFAIASYLEDGLDW